MFNEVFVAIPARLRQSAKFKKRSLNPYTDIDVSRLKIDRSISLGSWLRSRAGRF
jgi:hypothetical protein